MIAKNILIKTILLGLIFSLISFNNLIAKSRYWSTKKVVSTNQLEIINKYFKKRMDLNPIEGIWLQEGYGTIAIIKDPSLKMLYRKYIIESFEDPSLNGTMDGTFTRTKAFDKYNLPYSVIGKVTDSKTLNSKTSRQYGPAHSYDFQTTRHIFVIQFIF